jgi:hypothetical protein
MRGLLAVVVAVAAQTASAQGPSARGALRSELLGCYELLAEPARPLYNATPGVRLDSAEVERTSRGEYRILRPLDSAGRPTQVPYPGPVAARWWVDSLTDSVWVSFVNGFSGATFVFAVPSARSDTLHGRVYNQWDFGPPFETDHRPARAIRRRCGSVSDSRPGRRLRFGDHGTRAVDRTRRIDSARVRRPDA